MILMPMTVILRNLRAPPCAMHTEMQLKEVVKKETRNVPEP